MHKPPSSRPAAHPGGRPPQTGQGLNSGGGPSLIRAASSAGSFALRAEVTVVGVVLALVDGELLEKVVFQGVGVCRALGLGGVIVPADGVDGGLDGLVVVVEVQPADRQVGLVEDMSLSPLRVLVCMVIQ